MSAAADARMEALRRSYERSAATYDERFRGLQYEKFRLMLDDAADLGSAPWLDLGCGTGLLRSYLDERGSRPPCLVGVDFSRAMLAQARASALPVACARLGALPFRDGTFGAVLAFTVLRIVSDADGEYRTLAEVARVLAPGGTFVLTVLRATDDPALAERITAAGFRPAPPRACGQDVGYRCIRV